MLLEYGCIFCGGVLQSSIRVMHQTGFRLSSLDGFLQRPDRQPNCQSSIQPVILSARARIEDARGRLTGAVVRFRDNPLLEFDAGPRFINQGRLLDLNAGISQNFELGTDASQASSSKP